jgi:purine-nucleoside phosphorylase
MPDLLKLTAESAAAIRRHWTGGKPRVGIILGTGLDGFVQQVTCAAVIDYAAIPHFPRATATSHRGQLVCGTLDGVPVIAMRGRFHAYEGYSFEQITLPVRVMKSLGVELLVVSNASGGLNPRFAAGDIVVVEDHINLMLGGACVASPRVKGPVVAGNGDAPGPRFPEMSRPYDPTLVELALRVAQRENFAAHRGVYVAVRGPNLETRAEYRFLRRIGGDVVGMSTVPEVLVASDIDLRVLALSTVTNVCLPDALGRVSGDEIVDLAAAAEPKVRAIVKAIVADVAGT